MLEVIRKRLLVSPAPHPDESPRGYELRLAEANGYDSPEWIHQFVKKTENLSSKMGSIQIGSSLKSFLRSQSGVCSACLRESEYIRSIWSVIPFTACPEHCCKLTIVCPNCGRNFIWNRQKVCECPCKYDLRNCFDKTVKQSEVMLSKHLKSLWTVKPAPIRADKKIPLYSLDIESLLQLITFTASQLRNQQSLKTKFNISTYDHDELHDLYCKAYDLYQDWPENYCRFLDYLRSEKRDVKEATGFRKDFGKYIFYLYKNFSGRQYHFLRQAFEDYLSASWDGGYLRSYAKTKSAIEKSNYLTARRAAEVLQIKHRRISGLVKRGLLQGNIRSMGSKLLCLVTKSSVDSLQKQYKKSVNITQAARLLGTSTENLKNLINSNAIEAIHAPGMAGGGKWKIPRENIGQLLDKLNARRSAARPLKTLRKSVCNIESAALRLRISTADLVKVVLDNKIQPCNKQTARSLKKIEFLKEDLIRYKI